HLEVIREAFAPLPVLTAELAAEEIVGLSQLAVFAKTCYGDEDVARRLSYAEPFRVDVEGDAMMLSMHLPFVTRGEVQLARTDHELVITVGPHRRALVLPDSLRRRNVAGAQFVGDRLVVEFT